MKTLILIIILFITPFLINEKDHITVRGKVNDFKTGDGMADCHVYVKDLNYGTITASDGSFILQLPKKYRHKMIVVSHVGYGNYQRQLTSNSSQKLRARLSPRAILMQGITIRPENQNPEKPLVVEAGGLSDNQK